MQRILQARPVSEEAAVWLEKIQSLAPLIVEHRDASDVDKRTSPIVMEGLLGEGFGRLSIPTVFGGKQVSLPTIAEILVALSKYDASVSWQICVQVAMGRLSDYISEEAAQKLYSQSGRFVVGAIHAGGTAIPEDDGYRLNGHWSFASGCHHADWLVCTATVETGDATKPTQTRMFFVPASECQILDTWDTLGMRGTGSADFTCRDFWVSKVMSVDADLLKRSPQPRETQGYAIGYYDFGTIAAMATVFGIAAAALDFFRDSRKSGLDAKLSAVLEEKFGRSLALLYSARLGLDDALNQAHAPNHGTLVGTHPRVAIAAATLTENSVAAANQIYSLAGASGVYKRNFLERCFRDIHTGSKHFTLSPLQFQRLGAAYLEGALA